MTTKSNSESKKLSLRRESLRALTTTNLEQVRGGNCARSLTSGCVNSGITK
jgi:hypothetical protein